MDVDATIRERTLMPVPSTPMEDGILLGLGGWLLAGLFLDGYAHAYVLDTQTEDFFTPWHGIFYAAFAAMVGWVAIVGYRRRSPGRLIDWFPSSHRLTLLGVGLFALGGMGDGVWHSAFGVEVGIDALLSPTHLLLLVGGLLIIWTPVRAATERDDRAPWLALGSVALVTPTLVFFIQYLWLLPSTSYALEPFDPLTGEGTWAVRQFLGAATAMVGVLLGPLLLVATRWRLPFGTATVVWVLAAGLEALAFSRQPWSVALVFLGGLTFDTMYRVFRHRPWHLQVAAAGGPAVSFAAYIVMAAVDGSLGWPPEIWGGLVVYAAMVGLGLALLQRSDKPAGVPQAPSPSRGV